MEKQYRWIIDHIDVAPSENTLNNVIKRVHWAYVRNDGNILGRAYGAAELPPPSTETFTDYDNITEEQAISWLKTILDEEVLKAAVEQDIENIRNPKLVLKTPPWRFTGGSPSLSESDAVIDNSVESLAQTLMQEYADRVAEVKFMVEKAIYDLNETKTQLDLIQASQNNN